MSSVYIINVTFFSLYFFLLIFISGYRYNTVTTTGDTATTDTSTVLMYIL